MPVPLKQSHNYIEFDVEDADFSRYVVIEESRDCMSWRRLLPHDEIYQDSQGSLN